MLSPGGANCFGLRRLRCRWLAADQQAQHHLEADGRHILPRRGGAQPVVLLRPQVAPLPQPAAGLVRAQSCGGVHLAAREGRGSESHRQMSSRGAGGEGRAALLSLSRRPRRPIRRRSLATGVAAAAVAGTALAELAVPVPLRRDRRETAPVTTAAPPSRRLLLLCRRRSSGATFAAQWRRRSTRCWCTLASWRTRDGSPPRHARARLYRGGWSLTWPPSARRLW